MNPSSTQDSSHEDTLLFNKKKVNGKRYWEESEMFTILQHQKKLGNQWKEIAKKINFANHSMVKNRFYSLFRTVCRLAKKAPPLRNVSTLKLTNFSLIISQIKLHFLSSKPRSYGHTIIEKLQISEEQINIFQKRVKATINKKAKPKKNKLATDSNSRKRYSKKRRAISNTDLPITQPPICTESNSSAPPIPETKLPSISSFLSPMKTENRASLQPPKLSSEIDFKLLFRLNSSKYSRQVLSMPIFSHSLTPQYQSLPSNGWIQNSAVICYPFIQLETGPFSHFFR